MSSTCSWAPGGLQPEIRWSDGLEGTLVLAIGAEVAEYPLADAAAARVVWVLLLARVWGQRAQEGGR